MPRINKSVCMYIYMLTILTHWLGLGATFHISSFYEDTLGWKSFTDQGRRGLKPWWYLPNNGPSQLTQLLAHSEISWAESNFKIPKKQGVQPGTSEVW